MHSVLTVIQCKIFGWAVDMTGGMDLSDYIDVLCPHSISYRLDLMQYKCWIQGVCSPGGDASGGNSCRAGTILLHSGPAARSCTGAGYTTDPAARHSNSHHHPARSDHHCTTTARTGIFKTVNKSFSKVFLYGLLHRLQIAFYPNKWKTKKIQHVRNLTCFNCTRCC